MTHFAFNELLGLLLQYYVQNVVSPEPPGPGPLDMSRQQIAVRARCGTVSRLGLGVAPIVCHVWR